MVLKYVYPWLVVFQLYFLPNLYASQESTIGGARYRRNNGVIFCSISLSLFLFGRKKVDKVRAENEREVSAHA